MRSTWLYAHWRPSWRAVLGTQDAYPHPKGARTEPSVTGFQWVRWPSGHPAALWVKPFGQRLGITSPEPTLYFDLDNRVVASLQRTHGSRWMASGVEMEDRRNSVLWTLHFSFSSFARCLLSSPWFRSHTICIQICAKCIDIIYMLWFVITFFVPSLWSLQQENHASYACDSRW